MRKKWSRVGVGKTLANDPCGPVSLIRTPNRGIKYKRPPARRRVERACWLRAEFWPIGVGVVRSLTPPSSRTGPKFFLLHQFFDGAIRSKCEHPLRAGEKRSLIQIFSGGKDRLVRSCCGRAGNLEQLFSAASKLTRESCAKIVAKLGRGRAALTRSLAALHQPRRDQTLLENLFIALIIWIRGSTSRR
jgi:hypothetical protein